MATLNCRNRILAGALVIAIVGVGPAIAHASDTLIDRWSDLIADASRQFAIPEAWIRAVMRAESRGKLELGGRPITSPAGAMGLMQIMPSTWSALRSRYGLGGDPYDPHDNIFAGAAYLRELYQQYGYPNLFAAYNAGPGRLEEFLRDVRPLSDETRAYLAEIDQPSDVARPTLAPAVGARLFFALSGGGGAVPSSSSGGLFVALRSH
jgi:soluble lytic murein transglycosylase-like protein